MKLAVTLEPINPNEFSNALTPYFAECIKVLMENSAREDFAGTGVDLIQASYVTITTMVQNSCQESITIIYQLMIPILQKLEGTLNVEAIGAEKAAHMQDLLCGVL